MSIDLKTQKAKRVSVSYKHAEVYYTPHDNQTNAFLKVYQGEDFAVAARNTLLGTLNLENIPAAPQGQEPIDITMETTKMGILEVSAVVRCTKGSNKITIKEHRLGMSKAEADDLFGQVRTSA